MTLAVPKISDVLEQRQDRIASDIQEADRLKSEAETVLKGYEIVLSKAKTEAQETASVTKINLASEISKETETLEKSLKEELNIADQKIKDFEERSKAEVTKIASQTARLIAHHIANIDIDRVVAGALSDPSTGGNPVEMTPENTRKLLLACC